MLCYFWKHFSLTKGVFFHFKRNGTLTEVSTINTGHKGMDKFGYLDQLNGQPELPFWSEQPCTNISASEGSFFPPREYTEDSRRYVYDKDLCRIIPLDYKDTVFKDGKLLKLAFVRSTILLKMTCKLQAFQRICTNYQMTLTVMPKIIQTIHASMLAIIKLSMDFRTLARANTVSQQIEFKMEKGTKYLIKIRLISSQLLPSTSRIHIFTSLIQV